MNVNEHSNHTVIRGIEYDTARALEVCECGHVRKDHADGQNGKFNKEISALFAFGHGKCLYCMGTCKCKQFTWASMSPLLTERRNG